jgi:hypothetical protein
MPSTQADPDQSSVTLQRRSVVSSFLFKYSDIHASAAEVARFRRSDKVRTYQLRVPYEAGKQTDEKLTGITTKDTTSRRYRAAATSKQIRPHWTLRGENSGKRRR